MRFFPLVVLSAILAAPTVASAQDCDAMALFREGTHQVRTVYNAKGKEESATSLDITSVTTAGSVVTATAHSVSTTKGKEAAAVDYTMSCEGGSYRVDMKSMMPAESTEAYKDWTLTMEGGDMGYPATLSAGQTLPDASMTMTFTMQGAPAMIPPTVMTYTSRNRVVVGPESVTTTAGSFETWKITYDVTFSMKGMVSTSQEMSGTEWFVHGLGPVKSEMWARGKLESTTVLTENR